MWDSLPEQYNNAMTGANEIRLRYDLDVLKAVSGNISADAESEILNLYIEFFELLSQ